MGFHIFLYIYKGGLTWHIYLTACMKTFLVCFPLQIEIHILIVFFIIYNAIDTIEDAFQGDREYIISKLVDYFDDQQTDDFEDMDEDEQSNTSRQKAVHVINVLKKNGWIGEEGIRRL